MIGTSGRGLQGWSSGTALRKYSLFPGQNEGSALLYPREGEEVEALEVAMATELVAMEPMVPSLVDRYFTRWYKAGKWGMMSVFRQPHWPDAIGTRPTHQKLRVLSPALHPHFGRN